MFAIFEITFHESKKRAHETLTALATSGKKTTCDTSNGNGMATRVFRVSLKVSNSIQDW